MIVSEMKIAPNAPLEMVEWRIDGEPHSDNRGGYRCRFVPYVDGRDVAQLLDEWVGPDNWRDDYEEGTLFGKPVLWCYLTVNVGGEWVTKRDVGTPPNFEAQKGGVSDAFKRVACIKWGVGRNVWSLPTVWAPCDTYEKNSKTVAKVSDKSLPAILAELKRQGFDANGGRVAQDEASESRGAPSRPEGEPGGAETVESGATPPSSPSSGAPALLFDYKVAEIIKAGARAGIEIKSKAGVEALSENDAKVIAGVLAEGPA